MAELDFMGRQFGATTGRRKPFPYSAFIESRIPSLYQSKSRKEEQDMAQRNYDLQGQGLDLEGEALAEAKRVSDIELGLKREQLSEAAKQGKQATAIGVGQTGLGAAYVGSKLMGTAATGAAPASSAAVAGAGGGAGLGELGAGGGIGASEAGLSGMQAAGIAAGLELQRPYISKPISKWGAENLPGGESEWKYIENVGTRAGQGAAIGSTFGPGGTAVGGVIGGGVGLVESVIDTVSGGCIIISAAMGKYSPEVEIAREYRDKHLDADSLRGYYMIAEQVVPMMEQFSWIKLIVKMVLVDPLILYGKYSLKKNPSVSLFATAITKAFLKLCKLVGWTRTSYTRENGEVF